VSLSQTDRHSILICILLYVQYGTYIRKNNNGVFSFSALLRLPNAQRSRQDSRGGANVSKLYNPVTVSM